jgi:hypothetical protein
MNTYGYEIVNTITNEIVLYGEIVWNY